MKKNWVLSQEAFNTLLDWLAANRDEAGIKYEAIRRRLITMFAGRRCYEAEDLADETINRVANKVPDVRVNYSGDPALYFYAVANNVYLEFLRKKPLQAPPQNLTGTNEVEEAARCLDECLQKLTPENRELVVEYYQEEGKAKIDHRKSLADRLEIAPNALRIRACRVRKSLEKCLERCLSGKVS